MMRVIHYLGLLLVAVMSLHWIPSSEASTDRYLHIPALGRVAEIGFIYDERTDELKDVTVFRRSVPNELITRTQNPTKSIDTDITNNYEDKFQLLDIDMSSAGNILAGLTKKFRGAAQILKDNRQSSHDVTGTLLYKYTTVAEKLQTFNDDLKSFYNEDLMGHTGATHLVTGIQWGSNLAINFHDMATTIKGREEIVNAINVDFKKLTSTFPSSENDKLNFSISLGADILLRSDLPTSHSKIQDLLTQIPDLVQNINGGKGVALEYQLTPMNEIRSHLKLTKFKNVVTHKLKDSTIKKFVYVFDDLLSFEQKLNDLTEQLNSQPNCLHERTREEIQNLRRNLDEFRDQLKEEFKETLIAVRSGAQPMIDLLNLVQESRRNISLNYSQDALSNFDEALKKINFCQTIKDLYGDIEYFGSGPITISTINSRQNSSQQPVYILFTKSEFTQSDPVLYTENLNLLLGTLYEQSSENKLMIVDCDFKQDLCNDVNQTAMYKFKNGKLIASDVSQAMEEEETFLQSQINDVRNNIGILFNTTVKTYGANVNECAAAEYPCKNGGECLDENDGFTCLCPLPFTGKLCQHEPNLCNFNECKNGGTCSRTANFDFLCNCPVGFYGRNCELDVDECSANSAFCLNGGSCTNTIGSYTCNCPVGFIGTNCELDVDECLVNSSLCLNRGNCTNTIGSYTCNCPVGFIGTNCELDVDECSDNSALCLNGGACTNTIGSYACNCPIEFNGTNCEVDVDECSVNSALCLNGGSCTNTIGSYTCTCPSEFNGTNCELDVDECSVNSALCLNRGTCRNSNGSYTCNCALDYTGRHCETKIDDCVGVTSCKNGGTCLDGINSYTCECGEGFEGDQCQITTSQCSTSAKASRSSLSVVTLDCGGIIRIPNLNAGSSFLVDYKSNKGNNNKQQCLWTFSTIDNGINYHIKVGITLLCEGFLSSGGALSVYNWRQKNNDMILAHHGLQRNANNYLATAWDCKLFLGYASGNTFGSGFLALVDILEKFSVGSATDVFKQTPGTEVFGPFPSSIWNYFSVVINIQQASTTFTLNYLDSKNLDSCSDDDTLDVYEIHPKSGFNRVDRQCGSMTSPRSYKSEYPFLATFRTEKSNTGRGFKLTWE